MKPLISFLFLVLLVSASSLSAQTAPPAVRDEIVVTASALPETVESTPAAVTVLTKRDIDDRAARDLADLLREVPGVAVSRSGSPGRATSLFTRGGNSTHTLVLWNGVEINNPYFAGYDWGRFSAAGVQQVEIVRGPYSALYGSDAVAGVVNVLTTPARSELRLLAEAGGNGLRNGQLGIARVHGSNTFLANVERRDDDGFAENDDFSQTSANLLWRWASASGPSAGITARHTSYDLGIPTNLNASATELVPSPNRRGKGAERQISIPLQQNIGRFAYELTLAESRREDDFADPDDPYGFTSGSTESTTRRIRLTTRVKTAGGTIVAGGEYEQASVDDVSTFGVSLANDERTEKSFFIENRISRPTGPDSRLELSVGVRRDDFDTFGAETSPRIAAAWIRGGNKFRAGYGHAFRAPSVGELYFPFSGNRELKPERGRSLEVGYDRAFDRGHFSATLFRSRYRNLIVFDNAVFAFGNVGRAESHGLELGLEQAITSAFRTTISYTWLDTEQDGSGDRLLRRPQHSGSLFTGYRIGRIDFGAVVIHSGRRDDVQPVAPFGRASNEAYTTADANVQLHLGRLTPYFKVENLTSERYEEILGYPSPRRRIVTGVRYTR